MSLEKASARSHALKLARKTSTGATEMNRKLLSSPFVSRALINAAMSGDSQALQEVLPDFSNLSNIEPTFNDDFQFNPADGTFSFSMNLISPLDAPVTINSFSLNVTDEN
jgi:hypothetical protein